MRILGLGGFDHNGSAAVVEKGCVVAFLEAERVTRQKNVGLADARVLSVLLDRLDVDRVDAIGIADRTFWAERQEVLAPALAARFGEVPLHTYSHHDCHAACALAASPWDEAVCVVFDGKGDGLSTSAAMLDRGGVRERLVRVGSAHSLGRLWWGVGEFCGLPGHHAAGKVMALAAYGRPLAIFDDHVDFEPDGGFRIGPGAEHPDTFRQVPRIVEWLTRKLGASAGELHPDAAASVQALTERIVEHVVSAAVRRAGLRRVCLAGGVALNGLANQALARSSALDDLYVPPCTDDRGLSLGAATLLAGERGVPVVPQPLGITAFLGPPAGAESPRGWRKVEGHLNAVADWLLAGEPVAWFQGGDEAGPRALGHRSILLSPMAAGTRDRMNAMKGREWFRPFGCSLKVESAREWFDLDGDSPYMLRIAAARADRADRVPGVLHVDGTSRIQTVRHDDDSGLWPLLDHLENAGHPPVLLNTSLNGRGEPLAHSAEDAADIAERLGIERLVIAGVPHVRAR